MIKPPQGKDTITLRKGQTLIRVPENNMVEIGRTRKLITYFFTGCLPGGKRIMNKRLVHVKTEYCIGYADYDTQYKCFPEGSVHFGRLVPNYALTSQTLDKIYLAMAWLKIRLKA